MNEKGRLKYKEDCLLEAEVTKLDAGTDEVPRIEEDDSEPDLAANYSLFWCMKCNNPFPDYSNI